MNQCRLTRRLRRLRELLLKKDRVKSRLWYQAALSEILVYIRAYRKGATFRRISKSYGLSPLKLPNFEWAAGALLHIIAPKLDRRYKYKLKAVLCLAERQHIEPDKLNKFLAARGGLNGCAKIFAEVRRV